MLIRVLRPRFPGCDDACSGHVIAPWNMGLKCFVAGFFFLDGLLGLLVAVVAQDSYRRHGFPAQTRPTCRWRLQSSFGKTHHTNPALPPKMGDDSQSIRCNSKGAHLTWLPRPKQHQRFPFTLAAGDLNAHSSLWDEHQPADQRGKTIEDWLISRHASILNNGEPTHANRTTGGLSTPDVTTVNNTGATKAEWTVGEDLGSDHQPITIAVSC